MATGDLYFKMLREKRQHLQQINRLQRQIDELQTRIETFTPTLSTIPPVPIPAQVRGWMKEYGIPWEVFWCYDHSWWHDWLDNCFPYFCDNSCHRCREESETRE